MVKFLQSEVSGLTGYLYQRIGNGLTMYSGIYMYEGSSSTSSITITGSTVLQTTIDLLGYDLTPTNLTYYDTQNDTTGNIGAIPVGTITTEIAHSAPQTYTLVLTDAGLEIIVGNGNSITMNNGDELIFNFVF